MRRRSESRRAHRENKRLSWTLSSVKFSNLLDHGTNLEVMVALIALGAYRDASATQRRLIWARRPMRCSMKKSCLPLVLLSLVSGTAFATHPPPPLQASCTNGEFTVLVTFNDGRHDGVPAFLEGRVRFDDHGFVEQIARVDDLVRIDAGPNIMWRGDGFHLRVNTSRDTSLFPAKFNGRSDDGNPIVIRNLVCSLRVS